MENPGTAQRRPGRRRAKLGILTRSAAPLALLGDASCRAPAPGPPSQARWSDPARGGPESRLREPPSPAEAGPAGAEATDPVPRAAISFPRLGPPRHRHTATISRNP